MREEQNVGRRVVTKEMRDKQGRPGVLASEAMLRSLNLTLRAIRDHEKVLNRDVTIQFAFYKLYS